MNNTEVKKQENEQKKKNSADSVAKGFIPLEKRKKVKKVPQEDLILSIKSLSSMLKASLTIVESLKVLSEQSKNKEINMMYKTIANDVSQGSSLSASMKTFPKIFNEMITSVVETGEEGGILEKNLVFLADFMKKENELRKKITGALVYPVIILGIAVVEMIGMVYIILPKLEELFMSFPNIPAFTMAIVNAASFIRANGHFIALGIVILGFILKYYFSTKSGKVVADKLAISFPIIKNLMISNILATFSRTLGILLGSGIPIAKSLKIAMATVNNSVYSNIIKNIYDEVKRGQDISTSLKKYPKYFPISYIKLIEVGEVSGTLEENLMYLQDYYESEVKEMSDNITTYIEPILLIVIGVVIGIMAITIVMPLYQFTSSING